MFKFITILALGLISLDLLACQCSKYPLSIEKVIEEFVLNQYGPRAKFGEEDIEWIKYYPTFYERNFAGEFMETSCGDLGPRGEPMFHCSWRDKNDLLIKFSKLNCETKIQVTSTYRRVKVKEIESSCHRY